LGGGRAEEVVDLVAEFEGEGEEGWGWLRRHLGGGLLAASGFPIGMESGLKTSNPVLWDAGFAGMKLNLAGCQMDPWGAGRLFGVYRQAFCCRWEDW
jgi:hypothetical protein